MEYVRGYIYKNHKKMMKMGVQESSLQQRSPKGLCLGYNFMKGSYGFNVIGTQVNSVNKTLKVTQQTRNNF